MKTLFLVSYYDTEDLVHTHRVFTHREKSREFAAEQRKKTGLYRFTKNIKWDDEPVEKNIKISTCF